MAKAAQIQSRVRAVRAELDRGIDRRDILEKFGKKWKVGKTTIDNYIKAAKELIAADAKRIQAIAEEKIQEDATLVAGRLLSVARKRELLYQIAEGHMMIPTEKLMWNQKKKKFEFISMVELPDHAARMKAIELDNKMSGDFAPDKHLNYNTDVSAMSDEELEQELKRYGVDFK